MSTSLLLLSVLSFLFVVFLIPETDAAGPLYTICDNTDTYTNTSKFYTNLELLFDYLASNSSINKGFYSTSVGQQYPNKAYGRALCRGDIPPDVCTECIQTAGDTIRSSCPNRSATVWYYACNLRYSNTNFLNSSSTPVWVYMWNINNVSDPIWFDSVLGNLMNNLSTMAAFEPRLGMYASGEANLSSSSTLYGLVQCVRDISGDDCYRCLNTAIAQIPNCCDKKQGGRVLGSICNIRFEIYPFYGSSASPDPSSSTPAIIAPVRAPPPPLAPTDAIPPSTNAAHPHNETRTRDNSSRIIPIIVPTIVVSIVLIIIALLLAKKTREKRKKTYTSVIDGIDESEESFQIDFDTVKVATNDFSHENKLGEGGFGPVYKGSLSQGQEIAVKRLSMNSGQGVQEFMNEVVLVAKLQHKNLVRILGCCVRGEEKLLVYEYVPNRSLDYFLFDPAKREVLNWECRYKIIEGIARGLLYLHEESRLRIIHRDLKAGNVLLDANMNPKISDFGMAKIFGVDQTQGNTNRIAGTYGYMSPEYAMHGQFSFKSDAFSFGVLLFEIITGQKNNTFYQTDRGGDILSYVWRAWNNGNVLEIIDPTICEQCSRSEAIRTIHIGLLCVQENATARPLMSSVVVMLNSFSITLPAPSAPAFFVSSVMVLQGSHLDSPRRKSSTMSQNDVSISELEPR